MRQEEPLACIVLNEGYERDATTAESIFEFSMEQLAYFKAPGWILFVDSLPRTASEKVQKAVLVPAHQIPGLIPGVIDMRKRKSRR